MEEDLNPDVVSLYIQEAKHFFKYKCTTSMSHSTLTLLHEEKCSQQNSLFTSNALQMYKVRVFFPLSTVIHIQLYQTYQFSLKLPIVEQQ